MRRGAPKSVVCWVLQRSSKKLARVMACKRIGLGSKIFANSKILFLVYPFSSQGVFGSFVVMASFAADSLFLDFCFRYQ